MASANTDAPNTLRREIGPAGAVSILAGIMVGSGIFYVGAIVFERVGMHPAWTLLAWIVGGLVTLSSGICYTELGAMLPEAGGFYVYLREAYGRRVAYVAGLSHLLLTGPGSIAALSMALSAAIAPSLSLDPFAQKVVAVAVVLSLTAIHMKGIGLSARIQTLLTLLKLVPIAVLLVANVDVPTGGIVVIEVVAQDASLRSALDKAVAAGIVGNNCTVFG